MGQPQDESMPGAARPVAMEVRGLSKSFNGIYALNDVSLEIRSGEIQSIVGGNGSGKSTLIKSLAGVQAADEGTLIVGDETFDLRQFTAGLARRSGVHVVHQHRTTFGPMTVAENLSIGRGFETGRAGGIRWRKTKDRAAELIERFGIRATPDTLVSELGPASETMLEIARALQDQDGSHDGVLLLDEPTAALPAHEVDLLLDALRGYAAQGQAVVFISHRLDEVMSISERVTVIRDGRVTGHLLREGLSRDAIVEAMVGHLAVSERVDVAPPADAPIVLAATGLSGGSVSSADLMLREGEIVGIAGLAGSGRSTLLRLLFGAQASTAGRVTIDGRTLNTSDPARTISAGVAMVPEDRANDGVFADLSVVDNFSIAHLGRFTRLGRVSASMERSATQAAITRFLVKAASPLMPIRALSGGNQQKIVIARWLVENPRVLLLDEPTQGVDVGARAELWQIIQTSAAEGLSVLLVSSDVEELTHLSTRILVMREGAIIAELQGPGLTEDDVNAALHALDVAA
jgi:ribose transport system ATP-binding protein